MPNRLASLLTASVLTFAAGAAQAESAPAATIGAVAPLTVQGVAPPKMVERRAQAFAQKFAAPANPELDQIARWRDPVCVEVLGLPAEQGALIKARLESVAVAVGLPKAREGCRADVEIVFTGRPQAIMDAVAQRREQLLGYYHRHDGVRLKQVTRPIQAWYVTSTLGSSSYPVDPARPLEVIDDASNGAPGSPPNPVGCGQSHVFTACLKSNLKNVLVVADAKALEGTDARLVADYLAMLTLTRPKSLDGCNALPSVIDAFAKTACADEEIPDGLTPGDAAYLTALYQSDPEAKRWVEQDDIAGRMAKILIKANVAAQ